MVCRLGALLTEIEPEMRYDIIFLLMRSLKQETVSGCYWASSTGLTAVSKFKPRLPAQWAVGTHHKGPSLMDKFPLKRKLASGLIKW